MEPVVADAVASADKAARRCLCRDWGAHASANAGWPHPVAPRSNVSDWPARNRLFVAL